uniref:Sugar phosphate transporter domain-containing protein n=1 Tax=Aegilops tauschii subsp. strangulata TaxID=200361 RepID=A0A453EW25_AEGTS
GCNTYNALSLSLALTLAVDVQQFNRCQIARSIMYCSIIIVGPSEEAKSQVQGFIGVVVLVGVYYNYSE